MECNMHYMGVGVEGSRRPAYTNPPEQDIISTLPVELLLFIANISGNLRITEVNKTFFLLKYDIVKYSFKDICEFLDKQGLMPQDVNDIPSTTEQITQLDTYIQFLKKTYQTIRKEHGLDEKKEPIEISTSHIIRLTGNSQVPIVSFSPFQNSRKEIAGVIASKEKKPNKKETCIFSISFWHQLVQSIFCENFYRVIRSKNLSLKKGQTADQIFKDIESPIPGELDLSGCKLTYIPKETYNLNGTTQLTLHNNSLRSLPTSLTLLPNLQILDLSYNKFFKAPEVLRKIPQLEDLNMDKNQLNCLPEWIGEMPQLQVLSLWGNNITKLPESFCKLTTLKELDLSANPLKINPEQLSQFTQLEMLIVSTDQIIEVPECLRSFSDLKVRIRIDDELKMLFTIDQFIEFVLAQKLQQTQIRNTRKIVTGRRRTNQNI